MKNIKRVAIFSQDVSHQMSQTTGLKRGFESIDIEAYAGFGLLDGRAMTFFLDDYKPDLVIEINRSRNQIRECTSKFNHVSWVWDYNLKEEMIADGFGGSLYNFFVIDPALIGHKYEFVEPWGYLSPGVDTEIFSPRNASDMCDFSMIGYLPTPISEQEKAMPVKHAGQVVCTLGDIFQALENHGHKQHHANLEKVKQIIVQVIQRHNPSFDKHNIPSQLLIYVEDRWVRSSDRVEFLESILSVSKNVRFYGYGGWTRWNSLAPYYRGPVFSNSQKANIYCNSHVNLHSGYGMHDRVLEAMSCGTAVLINDSHLNHGENGIHQHFELDSDFVHYNEENVQDVAKGLLSRPSFVAELGTNARQKIIAAHTWKHRATKILDVLNNA